MTTIGDIIKENNLKVEISVVNQNYICRIKDGTDTFEFSMTEKKLVEHIKRFVTAQFVDVILANENMKKTHFLRLAVTWWHIQTMGDKLYHTLNIE